MLQTSHTIYTSPILISVTVQLFMRNLQAFQPTIRCTCEKFQMNGRKLTLSEETERQDLQ